MRQDAHRTILCDPTEAVDESQSETVTVGVRGQGRDRASFLEGENVLEMMGVMVVPQCECT